MQDAFGNQSIDAARREGIGTPAAQPQPVPVPIPDGVDPVAWSAAQLANHLPADWRYARAAPDWGLHQENYEKSASATIAGELIKRGYKINPDPELVLADRQKGSWFPHRGLAKGAFISDANAFWSALADARARDPNFLPDYSSVHDASTLSAWARDKRNDDMRKATAAGAGQNMASTLVAGLGSGMLDPTSYIPIGGQAARGTSVARQILGQMIRQGAANMAIVAGQEPFTRQDAASLGVTRTWAETATDIGTAGLLGGVLGGAERAGHIAVRGPGLPETDRGLVDHADAAVPPDARTPDEAAAGHVVDRAADISANSPYKPGLLGDEAHLADLQAAFHAAMFGDPMPDGSPPLPVMRDRGMPHEHRAIEHIESGGQQFDSAGEPLTSPKGAVGVMQVMPATGPEAAQLAGLPWDEHRFRTDEDYNRALGRAYYDKQFRDFGDPMKAAAAYNAGPGAVRRAVRLATGAGAPETWVDHLPEETRQYVEHFAELSGGEHAPEQAAPEALPPVDIPDIDPHAFDFGKSGVLAGFLSGESGLPAMRLESVRPDEVGIDANTMQFKAGGDAQGVTDRLQGVQRWEPSFAGRIMLWEGNDGRLLVADGHQRVGLAKRLMALDPAQEIHLDAMVMREGDGISARDARVVAAIKNLAEGTGSAIDAAKVARDAGADVLRLVPPRSATARDARALASLGHQAFGMAINELVPAEHAAIVGRLMPDDPERQVGLLHLLMETDPANATQAEAVVRQGIAAGFATKEFQPDLFGGRAGVASLFLQRAKLLDQSLARLRRLKLVYATAAREASTLEQVGSSIARGASAREAQANAEAIALVERLAHVAGPVKDALDEATHASTTGTRLTDAVQHFVDAVRGIDLAHAARTAGDAGAGGDGSGRGVGAVEAHAGLASADAERAVASAPESAAALELFSDPVGEGAKAQVDSLEHDLRMAQATPEGTPVPDLAGLHDVKVRLSEDGGETTIGDLLAGLDDDLKAVDTMRGCMAPVKGEG